MEADSKLSGMVVKSSHSDNSHPLLIHINKSVNQDIVMVIVAVCIAVLYVNKNSLIRFIIIQVKKVDFQVLGCWLLLLLL